MPRRRRAALQAAGRNHTRHSSLACVARSVKIDRHRADSPSLAPSGPAHGNLLQQYHQIPATNFLSKHSYANHNRGMSTLLEAEEKPAQEPVVPVQQYNTDSSPLQQLHDDGNESYDVLYAQDSWDDVVSDEEPIESVDDLILHLQHLVAATDRTTIINCLEQLTRSYRSIVGCDGWHQLLQLLPQHLTATANPGCSTKHHSSPAADSVVHSSQLQDSSADRVAAAAEQLLLQKLAPEVLDCSPEPLAELLLALLTASSHQNCWVGSAPPAAPPDPQETLAPQEVAAKVHALPTGHTHHHLTHSNGVAGSISPDCISPFGTLTYSCLSSGTVQLIVVGLHKIARQWHFLDERISQQLSNAVVRLLLEPLQLLLTVLTSNSSDAGHSQLCALQTAQIAIAPSQLSHPSSPPGQLQQQYQALGAMEYRCCSHDQQELVQPPKCPFSCCLAERLVIADPAMCWLHRINACSASGRMLRKAMTSGGLIEQLQNWFESFHFSEGGQSSLALADVAPAAPAQDSVPVGSGDDYLWGTAASSMSSHCTNGLMHGQQHMQHCLCVVYQLLSALMETPSGRKLLASSQCDLANLSAWQQHNSATADEGCTAGHPANRRENSTTSLQKAQPPGELARVPLSAAVASLSWLARQAVPKDFGDAALLAAAESANLALDAILQAPGERLVMSVQSWTGLPA